MLFSDLKIGLTFTFKNDGGLFVKVPDQIGLNAMVLKEANISSPVPAGSLTSFQLHHEIEIRHIDEFPHECLKPSWMVESKYRRGLVLPNNNILWYGRTQDNVNSVPSISTMGSYPIYKVWANYIGCYIGWPKKTSDLWFDDKMLIWQRPEKVSVSRHDIARKFGIDVSLLEIES